MTTSQREIYKLNCENLNAVIKSYNIVELDLKKSLRKNDIYIQHYTLYLAFLSGAYIENMYYKLVYEPNFTVQDRISIKTDSRDSLSTKWNLLLDYGFRKAYNLNSTVNLEKGLKFTPRNYYTELKKFINDELNITITIRNKVAHGQFIHSFNNNRTNSNPDTKKLIENQNLFTIRMRIEKFRVISKVIHDLIITPKTFVRDFDTYYEKYERVTNNCSPIKYEEFLLAIKKRYDNRNYKI